MPSKRRGLPSRKGTPEAPRYRAAVYDAGAATRRTLGWFAPSVSPNRGLLDNLTSLRDRSRQAVRNDGYAGGVIDKLVYNLVGTGIKPLPLADKEPLRKEIANLWLRWTDESDAAGLLDFYGQQAQAVRCWLEAGEVFIRLRSRFPEDGLAVPLQLEVIEPELCPHTYNVTTGRNRVRAGIEFDPIGRRTAYYFYTMRPADPNDWDFSDLRRVPAEQVIHLYKPTRPGQLRGLPHLTRALIRLRELDKFDDATLLRQQLSAMFVAFLKRSSETDTLPLTDGEITTTRADRPILSLEPGAFQELEPGEEVSFSEPPPVLTGYRDFIRQHLSAVSAATGVPYEVLTGDLTGISDRTVRVILHEFRRLLTAEQHQTVAFQFCRPVWRAWFDRVFLAESLDGIGDDYLEDPEPYARVKWMPQGWPYLHPVQDVQAATAAIRAGFTSRADVVSEQGEDAALIDEQQALDNARADALGLKYDSDARATGGGAPADPTEDAGAEPPEEPTDDAPDDPEEEEADAPNEDEAAPPDGAPPPEESAK